MVYYILNPLLGGYTALLESLFVFSAVFGGVLTLFQFVAGDHGGHHDVHVGAKEFHSDHGSKQVASMVTIRGIFAGIFAFGCVGGLLNSLGMGPSISLTTATLAGLTANWIVGRVISMMVNLETSGEFNINNAIGNNARVYYSIPSRHLEPNSTGKIQVSINGTEWEIPAVSSLAFAPGDSVYVANVINGIAHVVPSKLTSTL